MLAQHLRFDQLKRHISVMQILAYYGLAQGLRVRGSHIVGHCPLHGGDNPTAFVVTPNKNLWRCFTACQQRGDIISLVRKVEQCSYLEAAQRLATLCSTVPVEVQTPTLQAAPFRPFCRALSLDPDCAFLNAKGILPRTARTFEVGLYHGSGFLEGCVGIRIHDAFGRPLGYLGRRLAPNAITRFGEPTAPRWRCPRGLPKRTVLYNYHRARCHFHRPLVVVECPWGVLRLAQLNIPAVALLGVQISVQQLTLLSPCFLADSPA